MKDPGNMGNLELFKKRADYAKYQLLFIDQYFHDYKNLIKNVYKAKPNVESEI